MSLRQKKIFTVYGFDLAILRRFYSELSGDDEIDVSYFLKSEVDS